jgi:hypothetical protein
LEDLAVDKSDIKLWSVWNKLMWPVADSFKPGTNHGVAEKMGNILSI